MQLLGERFGAPNTPATEVLSHLGKPDELTPTLPHELSSNQQHVATMPGMTCMICQLCLNLY
jgi:hypothetical protein